DHERMQQRFELRGHHQVHQEHRQREGEQQRAHRFAQLLALATEPHANLGTQRVGGHPLLDFRIRRAQVDAAHADRHEGVAALPSSSHWPPSRMPTSAPSGLAATICWTSVIAAPRSMSRRLADTRATRRWSARWISLGPVVETTSATEPSSTGAPEPGLTIRRRMSSTDERSDSATRTSTSILRSRKL